MEADRQREREEMEEQFRERLQSVKDEFAHELVESSREVEAKYKRLLGTIPVSKKPPPNPKSMQRRRGSQQQRFPFNFEQISESQLEQFIAEKEEVIQTAETRHRHKIKDMENQIRYANHPIVTCSFPCMALGFNSPSALAFRWREREKREENGRES